MVDECVVAVYSTLDKAQGAIQRLTDGGFPAAQVSLVTVDLKADPAVLEDLKVDDDSLHNAAVGAGLGASFGLLSGLSILALSGLGIAFLAGPIGAGIIGSLAGAFLGAMGGFGIHEHKIEHYQRLVEAGNVVVFATGDPLQLAHGYRLLEESGPSEIHTYARTGDDARETAA